MENCNIDVTQWKNGPADVQARDSNESATDTFCY